MKLGNRALLTVSKPESMKGVSSKVLDAEYIFFTQDEIERDEYKAIKDYCRKATPVKDTVIYITHVEKAFIDEELDEELEQRDRQVEYDMPGFKLKGEADKDGVMVGIFQYYGGDNTYDHVVNRNLKEALGI